MSYATVYKHEKNGFDSCATCLIHFQFYQQILLLFVYLNSGLWVLSQWSSTVTEKPNTKKINLQLKQTFWRGVQNFLESKLLLASASQLLIFLQ